jgi:hypothetical protein
VIHSAPPPVFRAFHKARPERIAFDVPAEDQKMLIALYGETLKAILINVALSDGATQDAKSFTVRACKMLKE